MNLIKNIFLNKKFKAEFFRKPQTNRQSRLLEMTWQGFARSFSLSFKRRSDYNRKARKERSRSVKINQTMNGTVIQIELEK